MRRSEVGRVSLKPEDLKALGLVPEGVDLDSIVFDGKLMMLAIGGSDQAPFLRAGLPGFWWMQEGDESVEYPAPCWTIIFPP